MRDKRRKVIIIIIGIVLNMLGRFIANSLNLPIWFDMIGTVFASYFAGMWGGIIAAVIHGLFSSLFDATAAVYLPINVLSAVMVHFFIKRGYMNSIAKALISSFWMGLLCTIASTPLNIIFYDGYSGNVWGDTFVDMLRWYDVSGVLSALAGEAIVEIVDKEVCILIGYLIIYAVKRLENKKSIKTNAGALVIMLGVLVTSTVQPFSMQAAEGDIQTDNFLEKIYNNTNGMVASEANVICETNDGYIWIGSYAGLTRYDGKEFEFVREGGLVNVVSMMTDSKGRLWIGTNDAGIARYENGSYTYFTEEDGLSTNSIRCFAEDKAGNVYVGTSDRICRFSPDDTIKVVDKDITFAKAMEIYNSTLIVLDNKGDIYALDEEKAITLDGGNSVDLFYYCLGVTSKGLMVGTDSGELFRVDMAQDALVVKEQVDISAEEISAIFEDSEKRIWIALESGFGYIDGNDNYKKMNYDDFDASIVYFHEDYQGNLWIASSDYGVMKLSESPFINLFEKAGINKEVVNAVEYYNGDYYCGTDRGLVVFDGSDMSQKTSELTKRVNGSRVRSIFKDSKNNLWLCTYNGLISYTAGGRINYYNQKRNNTTSDRFRCITELEDGSLVTGTADGINFIKDGSVTGTLSAADGLANTQILSIVQGMDGNVWAGSDGSGIYIISEGKLVENYTVEDGLSSNIILRIVPHADGYLIVTSNALCHIDLDGTIRRLSNFPYFNNYDVIIDGETAYIPCSAGIYEIPLAELCADSEDQPELYSANEGLLSGLTANSWNYVSETGKLYLCSNSGVVVFSGNGVEAETNMKYGIVSVEYDGTEQIVSDNNIVVPAGAKNISVYASVRNYAFTDVNVRFYVKGFEENPKLYAWNEIEPVYIYKPDLSGYSICLQILDGSGENVLQEEIYTITREAHEWEKPIYKTYLAVVCSEILLFTIISIGSMILIVIRKNELERLGIELIKKVDERTGELREQQHKTKKLFIQTVAALSEAVDAKDRYTSGHSKRVAEYSRMIAARLGKDKEEQEEIYRAGLLHDVGKIRIPVEIINKAGKLTDEEYNIIKLHPVTGYHILRGISDDNLIAIAAKYHHERYDGRGYPNGISGEGIPEVARILGVADSYDAMTSNRSYRGALPQDVVRNEILKGRGTQFDPRMADIMLQMIDEDKEYTMQQGESLQKRILVVDDEIMNHKVIEHIMKDEPMYEISSAFGGKEALEILEGQTFDLILLDLKMPEMDGAETLRLIRQKHTTPVVLMTGDKTLNVDSELSEFDCDDYITKPVLPLLVKEIVHNLTEKTDMEN